MARRRHVAALNKTDNHFQLAETALGSGRGELLAEELRLAHQALGEITGQFSSEDLLGKIFTSFCIGK